MNHRIGAINQPNYPLRHAKYHPNRDHKALNSGTLGGVGTRTYDTPKKLEAPLDQTGEAAASGRESVRPWLQFRTWGPPLEAVAPPNRPHHFMALILRTPREALMIFRNAHLELQGLGWGFQAWNLGSGL